MYPVVPYAYEYVRLATKTGGFSGLAKSVIRQIVFTTHGKAIAPAVVGSITANPSTLMKTYLIYELSRVKHAAGNSAHIKSIILHEVITDMALSLNFDWLFVSYVKFMLKNRIRPGLHTRNLPYLVKKLGEWGIDPIQLTILAPFNKIGFQMNPSKTDFEKTLESISGIKVIAMSILASGYLKPPEAISYVAGLPNLTHIAVGVSNEHQAIETFRLLREKKQNELAHAKTDMLLDLFSLWIVMLLCIFLYN